MASQKLTNHVRDQIVREAGRRGTEKLTERLSRLQSQMSKAARAALVPKSVERAMADIPKEHLSESMYAHFQIAGREHLSSVTLDEADRWGVPSYMGKAKAIPASSRLAKLIDRHAQAKQEALKLRREIEKKTREIVYSVTTTGRLIEIWPEAEQLLPKPIATIRVNAVVPVGVVAEVNKMLGLKKAA